VVFEHQIIRNRHRHDRHAGKVGTEAGAEQPGLRVLQLAAVAAAAFGIEEQIVGVEQRADVGLQRDQVGGILGIAPDRQRPRDVLVDEPERPAEQVDAGGDDRWPDSRIVQHQRFDQVVGVAAMVRGPHHAALRGGRRGVVGVLGHPVDLPQDRVERVFERAVQLVALRGPQLLEIFENPCPRLIAAQAVAALEIAGHLVPVQYCFGDVIHLARAPMIARVVFGVIPAR
jgi:hypothetical protein